MTTHGAVALTIKKLLVLSPFAIITSVWTNLKKSVIISNV